MKKINVQLYGGKGIFGGKETPLNVDIAYCDKCDNCSFYKSGTCFNAGRWKADCKIGHKENVSGYTSRANKYYDFQKQYMNDEVFNKLKEPSCLIGIVDGTVILNIRLMKFENDYQVKEDTSWSDSQLKYIPLELLTNKIIKDICDLRPRTWFENTPIKSYYEEIIPHFLDDLKRHFKDIYQRFVNEYPEYNKEINYVGREAFIYSLKDGTEILTDRTNGAKFIKNNDYLINNNYRHTFMPFDAKSSEIKIKIDENMKCKITDNNQVDENTVFSK